MKILSIVGARPQFVKVSPVDEELKKRNHEHIIVHTGQHYDYEMSKAFFEQLSIPEPDYNLEVGSGTHAYQTGQMLMKLGEVISEEQPEIVMIYGDTNSTLAGALAAVKLLIPVAHVESGYRSFDMTMPEEINRIIADRVSQILFAPTKEAAENLKNEGIKEESIHVVGDIMVESLLKNLNKADSSTILEQLGLEKGKYVLMTLHRQENVDNPERLKKIFTGLSETPLPIVFPCHPRTRKRIEEFNIFETSSYEREKLIFIKPLPYLDFIKLEKEAAFVVTDSGGVQGEALILSKPCVTLRYNTEKTETIKAGSNELAGAEPERIKESVKRAYQKHIEGAEFELPELWDDKVSKRIVDALEEIDDPSSLLRIPESF
jgi:UDP-N-acetylglucosamine 2-epimerase (non-hydrolysing)